MLHLGMLWAQLADATSDNSLPASLPREQTLPLRQACILLAQGQVSNKQMWFFQDEETVTGEGSTYYLLPCLYEDLSSTAGFLISDMS